MSNDHKDEQKLRELYIDKGLSTREVGERLGVTKTTVRYWMDKHDIDARDNVETQLETRRKKPVYFRTTRRGYERWHNNYQDESYVMQVHRLLAIAEYGTEAIADKHVHHKNGIPWDNRPSNIEIMEPGEHISLHHERGDNPETNHVFANSTDNC